MQELLTKANPTRPTGSETALAISKSSRTLIIAVLLISGMGIFVDLSTNISSYQLDLKTYYYAGKAFASGLNPYDVNVLSELAGDPVNHPFVYPPATLLLFRHLANQDFVTTYYLYLAIKGIALAMLMYLWKRRFLPAMDAYFVLFCIVAFNAAIYIDLRTGNISILEQLLIWTALIFLTRKPLLFMLIILIVASFKISPILFLGMLLLYGGSKKNIYFVVATLLFLIMHLGSFYLNPDLYTNFVSALAELDERGVFNPSTYALVTHLFEWLGARTGTVFPEYVERGVYLFVAASIGIVAWRSWLILRSEFSHKSDLVGIYLALLTYALVLPRFKPYSYILVLVPCYYILSRVRGHHYFSTPIRLLREHSALFVMALISSAYAIVFRQNIYPNSFIGYSPLIATFIVWCLYILTIELSMTGRPTSVLASHASNLLANLGGAPDFPRHALNQQEAGAAINAAQDGE